MQTRKAIVADQFYPGQHDSCIEQINECIGISSFDGFLPETITAGIVPHAGWTFSGALAARTILNGATPARTALAPRPAVTVRREMCECGAPERDFFVIGIPPCPLTATIWLIFDVIASRGTLNVGSLRLIRAVERWHGLARIDNIVDQNNNFRQ